MTASLHHIVKAPVGLPPQTKKPITWEQLCEFARAVLDFDERRRPLTTGQTQAINRLDTLLMGLKQRGEIVDFSLGEFTGDRIEVMLTVPDERYFRQYLLPLYACVEEALGGLDIYAAVEIDTDLKCDDAAPAH